MADRTPPLESGQLLSPELPILASPPPPAMVNGEGPQQVDTHLCAHSLALCFQLLSYPNAWHLELYFNFGKPLFQKLPIEKVLSRGALINRPRFS